MPGRERPRPPRRHMGRTAAAFAARADDPGRCRSSSQKHPRRAPSPEEVAAAPRRLRASARREEAPTIGPSPIAADVSSSAPDPGRRTGSQRLSTPSLVSFLLLPLLPSPSSGEGGWGGGKRSAMRAGGPSRDRRREGSRRERRRPRHRRGKQDRREKDDEEGGRGRKDGALLWLPLLRRLRRSR